MHRQTHTHTLTEAQQSQAQGAVICFEVRLQEGTQVSSTLKHAAMPQTYLCSGFLRGNRVTALHVALDRIPAALGGGCRSSLASSCLCKAGRPFRLDPES